MEDYIINRLIAANIPMTVHETKLADIMPGGASFKHYMDGENYQIDKEAGTGLCVFGPADHRVKLFPVVARAMCIAGDNVFYAHSIVLRDIACSDGEHPHPLLEKAMNCNALFLSNFCTAGEVAPYTPAERAMIEQFLIARSYSKRRNYFSTNLALRMCVWWSSDFVEDQMQFMRDVQV